MFRISADWNDPLGVTGALCSFGVAIAAASKPDLWTARPALGESVRGLREVDPNIAPAIIWRFVLPIVDAAEVDPKDPICGGWEGAPSISVTGAVAANPPGLRVVAGRVGAVAPGAVSKPPVTIGGGGGETTTWRGVTAGTDLSRGGRSGASNVERVICGAGKLNRYLR